MNGLILLHDWDVLHPHSHRRDLNRKRTRVLYYCNASPLAKRAIALGYPDNFGYFLQSHGYCTCLGHSQEPVLPNNL